MPAETLTWLREDSRWPKFYFGDRASERWFAGVGKTEVYQITTPLPIEEIEKKLKSFTKNHPTVFCSIRFDTEKESSSEWKEFATATFIAPEELRRGRTFSEPRIKTNRVLRSEVSPSDAWCELFDAATSAFESEGLDKVILASREKIEVFKDFWSVTIQAQSPFSFVFSPEENLAFFGVSPESLYRKLNGETTCDALAGTRLRGQEKDQDLELIEELLQSKKDRDEHQLVVDFLQQRMKTFCKDVYVSETGVKTLNHLFHLHTIVQGKGAKEGNVLSHLHPTPALSGSPQGHAISFLRKNESFDRGHYGGAIGIIERDFESFSVAIRSVLQRRDEAFVFFGAGVIPSSCCEEEWTEILAKRDAILANLEYSQGKK